MTHITVKKHENFIYSMRISGHTGSAPQGQDVLCACISGIAQTAVLGVLKIANIDAKYEINEDEGFLSLILPFSASEKQKELSNAVLETAILGLKDLQEGYSKYIKMEVIEDVY